MNISKLGEWFGELAGDLAALELRIAIVIGLAWLTARALRRRSSAVEHRVWTLAIAAIVMLPLATMLLPAFGAASHSIAVGPSSAAAAATTVGNAGELAWAWADDTRSGGASPVSWRAWVVALWAAGAAVLFGQVLVRLVGARLLVAGSAALPAALAARVAEAVGDTRVPIRIGDRLASPVVLGVVRPVVLLPRAATSWSTERLRAVLVHEIAHVAHGDHRWLVVAAIARAIAWIDPLVWWTVVRVRAVAELAADDAVVAAGIDPHDYARELVEVARASVGAHHHAFAPSIAGRAGLPERVAALLLRGRSRARVPGRVAVPLAIGTIGAVASLAAVHMFDETRTVVRLGDGADETLARAFVERTVADGTRPSGELVVIRGGMIELRSETGASVARVPLDGDAVAPAHLQGHLVVPLSGAFSGARIWVDAEGTIPWSTIADVLYTAGRSGVREYGLRHGERWLDVSPPTFHRDPAQAPARERDALRVHVKFAGGELAGRIARGLAVDSVAVHGGDGCSLAPRLDTSTDADDEQSAAARRLCAIGAGHYVLTLSPGPSVPIDEVARTIERFVDVPGCDVDVVVESGDEAPPACDPDAQALATFE